MKYLFYKTILFLYRQHQVLQNLLQKKEHESESREKNKQQQQQSNKAIQFIYKKNRSDE